MSFTRGSRAGAGAFLVLALPALAAAQQGAARAATADAAGVQRAATTITATVVGGRLVLSWPEDHTGWALQSQTNAAGAGLSANWVTIPGANLSNAYTNAMDPANGSVFYRLQTQAP